MWSKAARIKECDEKGVNTRSQAYLFAPFQFKNSCLFFLCERLPLFPSVVSLLKSPEKITYGQAVFGRKTFTQGQQSPVAMYIEKIYLRARTGR